MSRNLSENNLFRQTKSAVFCRCSLIQWSCQVNAKCVNQGKLSVPLAGAALTAVCGLVLWITPMGRPGPNASYDYSFRFGSRPVTNKISLVMMDNEAFAQFHQTRGQPWTGDCTRSFSTSLPTMLAISSLWTPFSPKTITARRQALANAIRRMRHIVLMAEQTSIARSTAVSVLRNIPRTV